MIYTTKQLHSFILLRVDTMGADPVELAKDFIYQHALEDQVELKVVVKHVQELLLNHQ